MAPKEIKINFEMLGLSKAVSLVNNMTSGFRKLKQISSEFNRGVKEQINYIEKSGKIRIQDIETEKSAIRELENKLSALRMEKGLYADNAIIQQIVNREIGKANNLLRVHTLQLKEANRQAADYETLISGPAGALADVISEVPLIGKLLAPAFRNPLDNIDRMSKSMLKFNMAFVSVAELEKGFGAMTNKLFSDFQKNAEMFGKNMLAIMSLVRKAIMFALGGGLKAIIPIIIGVIGALWPIIGTIALIVAAIYTIKKIWEYNIGGIQASVFGLVGLVKDTLGKAFLNFMKLLQRLGPIFKILFTVIFLPFKILVTVLGGVFDAIFAILDPIFEVFEELFKPFADSATGSGNIIMKIVKGLATVIGWLGKVVGGALKIILMPFIFLAKVIALVLSPVKLLKALFAGMKLPGWLQKVIDFFTGGKKTSEVPAAAKPAARPMTRTGGGVQNVSNVNSNMTVNTSRSITPDGARGFLDILGGALGIEAKRS